MPRKPKLPPADWPFLDPQNLATISLRRIFFEDQPILLVHHHADGDWQFHDGGDFTNKDACVVGLEEVIARDPTLVQVATLPRGWYAVRSRPGTPWWVAPEGVSIRDAYAPAGDPTPPKRSKKKSRSKKKPPTKEAKEATKRPPRRRS